MKRIVRMHFRTEAIDHFLALFREYEQDIRTFEGCLHMELLRDTSHSNIFFTWSWWESEKHLNAYRKSALFGTIWPQTKALFAEPAEAWSLEEITQSKAQ